MPTGTGLSIVTRSLQEAGVIGQNQVPVGSQGLNGLLTLNGMIDSWTIDDRYVYCRDIIAYALTANQQAYPIGPTAAAPFTMPTAPRKIINANVILPDGLSHMPIEIIDDDQRMDIFNPTIAPSLPLKLNYRADFPNGNLWLWFTPAGGYQLELETDRLLTEFATLAITYSFPPGYYEAIIYSLAERFCTPAWGREASPTITKLAEDARAKIEGLNLAPPPQMSIAPEAYGIDRGSNAHGITRQNNILTGERFYRR